MQKERKKLVKVESIFLYDVDGIFKSVPLSRFRSLLSNFLDRGEKLNFFLFGRLPVKILELLNKQRTFDLKLEKDYLGLNIYVVLEDSDISLCDDLVSLPKKRYVPLLVLIRTFDELKAILFTEDGGVFGDKGYLKFFIRG